ncbi:MAG: IclR family transcriptional regulator C-terminal domain-containing protein, partial [Pseudomonadota bacterium]
LALAEIAQRLKRSISEIFRVIIVMERRQWLRKDPESSRFALTYRMLALAHHGTPAQTLTLAATPVMKALSLSSRQACHLVVRSGHQGLVIQRQESIGRASGFAVRLGVMVDLITSCSGHVLLAFTEASALDEVLASIPRPWGLTEKKLMARLGRVRRQGYDLQPSPLTGGVTDISYPIRDFDGTVVAALTIPYLRFLDDPVSSAVEVSRRHLETAANQVSRSLGFNEGNLSRNRG